MASGSKSIQAVPGALTVTNTGAEVKEMPLLSVATAVRTYPPAGGLLIVVQRLVEALFEATTHAFL